MEEFLNNLSSPSWWIGVIIIGIILNLVAAYLKTHLDTRLSRFSKWWRDRSEIRKKERESKIKKLRNNPQEQILFAVSALRFRIRSVHFLTVTIMLFVFTLDLPIRSLRIFLLAIAALALLFSLSDHTEAVTMESLVNESRKDIDEEKTSEGI